MITQLRSFVIPQIADESIVSVCSYPEKDIDCYDYVVNGEVKCRLYLNIYSGMWSSGIDCHDDWQVVGRKYLAFMGCTDYDFVPIESCEAEAF